MRIKEKENHLTKSNILWDPIFRLNCKNRWTVFFKQQGERKQEQQIIDWILGKVNSVSFLTILQIW